MSRASTVAWRLGSTVHGSRWLALCVLAVLPASVHDLTAARQLVLPTLRPRMTVPTYEAHEDARLAGAKHAREPMIPGSWVRAPPAPLRSPAISRRRQWREPLWTRPGGHMGFDSAPHVELLQ